MLCNLSKQYCLAGWKIWHGFSPGRSMQEVACETNAGKVRKALFILCSHVNTRSLLKKHWWFACNKLWQIGVGQSTTKSLYVEPLLRVNMSNTLKTSESKPLFNFISFFCSCLFFHLVLGFCFICHLLFQVHRNMCIRHPPVVDVGYSHRVVGYEPNILTSEQHIRHPPLVDVGYIFIC